MLEVPYLDLSTFNPPLVHMFTQTRLSPCSAEPHLLTSKYRFSGTTALFAEPPLIILVSVLKQDICDFFLHSGQSCFLSISQKSPSVSETTSGPQEFALSQRCLAECSGCLLEIRVWCIDFGRIDDIFISLRFEGWSGGMTGFSGVGKRTGWIG